MNKNRLRNIECGLNVNECTVVVCLSNEEGCVLANENGKSVLKMYKCFDDVKELYNEGEALLINVAVSNELTRNAAEMIGIEIHRNSEKELSIDKIIEGVKKEAKRMKEESEQRGHPIT